MSTHQQQALNLLFGQKLREARNGKGWSLDRLAGYAEISRDTIWDLETGNTAPRLDTIWKLAGALGLNPADLLPTDRQVTRRANALRKASIGYLAQTRLDLQELAPAANQ